MKKIAAFFDIDGTIYREGLITELFKKLITHELVSENIWVDSVKPAFMKWDKRQGYYDEYLDRMVEMYIKSIIGVRQDHITHIAKRVIEQKGDRVYRFTRSEIERHRNNGDMVIAVSGSPAELVSEMAKKYHFDDYRGTTYVLDSGNRYTGEIIPMWDRESKRKAILDIADQYDLDLVNCYAYGDTTGDLVMLSLVGHPYAINPTKSLIEAIKRDEDLAKKITIIVERKDMIYRIPLELVEVDLIEE
ncbi:HAD-IB family hydrolase [Mycoplasmatota bacterium]|nr:HAD-IB family hydrolase [Mycoplasmatota bacterium]